MLSAIELDVFMLSVAFCLYYVEHHAEFRILYNYAARHSAECRYAECHGAKQKRRNAIIY